MEQKLSPYAFFRAFDLAFFVPGVILLLSIEYSLRQAGMPGVVNLIRSDGSAESTAFSVRAIAEGISMLVIAYVAGLTCHSITWGFVQWRRGDEASVRNRLVKQEIEEYLTSQTGTQVINDLVGQTTTEARLRQAETIRHQLADRIKLENDLLVAKRIEQIKDIPPGRFSQFLRGIRLNSLADQMDQKKRNEALRNLVSSIKSADESCEHEVDRSWTNDKQLISEYMSYFWYLRSTCWNLATAMVLAGFINLAVSQNAVDEYQKAASEGSLGRVMILLSMAALFYVMGGSYNHSHAKRRRLVRTICRHEAMIQARQPAEAAQACARDEAAGPR